jgi:hypothetical protein
MGAQGWDGSGLEKLDEFGAVSRLDSIASDFHDHGLPPEKPWINQIGNFVGHEYNLTYEFNQEGTFG